MRCKYCRTEIKDGLSFCTQCGKELIQVEKIKEQAKGENNFHKINLQFCIGIAALIAIIFCFILNNGNNGASHNNVKTDKVQAQQIVKLDDVKKWYILQIPRINECVKNSWNSNPLFSNGKVVKNKFYFGNDGGWYDCHYTVLYNIDIQGVPCRGEMRFFLKYKSTDIHMWSHSVFEVATGTRIYRDYDEKYENIIENYYKYLIATYK